MAGAQIQLVNTIHHSLGLTHLLLQLPAGMVLEETLDQRPSLFCEEPGINGRDELLFELLLIMLRRSTGEVAGAMEWISRPIFLMSVVTSGALGKRM